MKRLNISDVASPRLNSFLWAFILLVPALIIANKANNRLVFHLLLFFTGWLSWTFNEYYMHRFVMHDGNQKKGLGKLLNHSHHHTDPTDIVISNQHRALLIAGSAVLITVSAFLNNYFTLIAGYVAGFTCYSLMHIMLHQKWSAKLFPHLQEFHIHHHCKHPDKCFGVTFTWWDHLFGTIPFSNTIITERIKNFYYKNVPENSTSPSHHSAILSERKDSTVPVVNKISGQINNIKNDSCRKCENKYCLKNISRNYNNVQKQTGYHP